MSLFEAFFEMIIEGMKCRTAEEIEKALKDSDICLFRISQIRLMVLGIE